MPKLTHDTLKKLVSKELQLMSEAPKKKTLKKATKKAPASPEAPPKVSASEKKKLVTQAVKDALVTCLEDVFYDHAAYVPESFADLAVDNAGDAAEGDASAFGHLSAKTLLDEPEVKEFLLSTVQSFLLELQHRHSTQTRESQRALRQSDLRKDDQMPGIRADLDPETITQD